MSLTSNVVASFAIAATAITTHSQQRRPIVPADCVSVRYLKSGYNPAIVVNPQETSVAYLVTSPNLSNNQNETQLYIKDLRDRRSLSSKLLLTADDISQIHWLDDGHRIVALLKTGSQVTISEINVETSHASVLLRTTKGIDEYDVDHDASVIAYSLVESVKTPNITPDTNEVARGYRISTQRSTASLFPQHRVYVTRRDKDGSWSEPEQVIVSSPFTGYPVSVFPAVSSLKLSLSPNGQLLLITFLVGSPLPPRWERSPYVHRMTTEIGFDISITVLRNLRTGKTTLPLESPEPWNLPLWSRDSRSYLTVAAPPVSSTLEAEDYRKDPTSYGPGHLFRVEVPSGKIEEVTSEVANISEQPLVWNQDGTVVVHTGSNTVGTFGQAGEAWTKLSSFTLPLPKRFQYGQLASNGSQIIGDYQSTAVPPELFLFSPATNDLSIIDKLNPQFDHLTLGPAKAMRWTTSTGLSIDGLLLLPPDYEIGKRYPLVIQTKPDYGQFLCDAGQEHYPSFAPQPIVNAGMLYLIRSLSDADADKRDENYFPKGYPGQIGETAFHMDMWDSAVEELNAQGLIDPNNVGIIGFSRAGWYTEFMLAHAKTQYHAATVADNVQYSLGEYWLAHSDWILHGFETMYGGNPYGSAQKNWMQYSISFNLDKIRAPLLMEEMGHGVQYSTEKAPPLDLALSFEVFSGLRQLSKPVELYYYPNEPHQLAHPQARLASMKRNVDWFRFWLEGYERPSPEDPDQYKRWEHLRDLQNTEDKAAATLDTSPAKPN
jgi:dipeptidyl aminopeptidase/acylaminoacyl peptidase